MWKYALMAFIQRMASAGSPEKSAGRATLSSGMVVDMGVVDGVEGVTGGLGGKTRCRCGLGVFVGGGVLGSQRDTVVTADVEGCGGGEGGLTSSSLESSKSPKAPGLRGVDMFGGGSCS